MPHLGGNQLLKAFFVVSLFGVVGNPAFAVLGETEAELVERYGKPDAVSVGDEDLAPAEKVIGWSSPDGYDVVACLIDGRSVREIYVLEEAVQGPVDATVKRLLNENADGDSWRVIPEEAMAGVNTLQAQLAELRGKTHPKWKYYYVQKRTQNQSRAFVLEDDPCHLEVHSEAWAKATE